MVEPIARLRNLMIARPMVFLTVAESMTTAPPFSVVFSYHYYMNDALIQQNSLHEVYQYDVFLPLFF